jgi:hypothetical protein
VLGVIPQRPIPNARKALPSVELGERLCHAYEIFRRVVPESRFTMDQFILLALSLAQGDELEVGHCSQCHAALLLDPLSASSRECPSCKQSALHPTTWALTGVFSPKGAEDESRELDAEAGEGYQESLF